MLWSYFIGSRGKHIVDPRNQAALIEGRTFTGHALDQMPNRGITLSVINNALQHGTAEAGQIKGTTAFVDATNKIKVIVDTQSGRVVTVMYYTPPKK